MSNGEMQPQNTPSLRIFEVEAAADDASALMALDGLVRAYGLGFREIVREAEPEGTPLTLEYLAAASAEVEDVDMYSRLAMERLVLERYRFPGYVTAFGTVVRWKFRQVDHRIIPPDPRMDSVGAALTFPGLEQHVRSRLDGLALPFAVSITPVSRLPQEREAGGALDRRVDLRVGDMAVERLPAFVQKREYGQHALSGAFGGMLDVLVRAAGLSAPERHGRVLEESDYVTEQELTSLVGARFSPLVVGWLYQKIKDALHYQLYTGQPTAYGEVVVGGNCRLYMSGASNAKVEFEKIARRSLAVIADKYCRETNMTKLLRALAEGKTAGEIPYGGPAFLPPQ